MARLSAKHCPSLHRKEEAIGCGVILTRSKGTGSRDGSPENWVEPSLGNEGVNLWLEADGEVGPKA